MAHTVGFFINQFGERGTEVSTYDYADFNESILKNKSIIITFINSEKIHRNSSRDKFLSRFKIIEIRNIEEMRSIIETYQLTHFYVQSHGFFREKFMFDKDKIWKGCQTIYHSVFGPMAPQSSSVRCVLGNYLNKKFKKKLPMLPYIVKPHKIHGNLRDNLGIPKEAIVFGRYGGLDTFDIKFVHKCIVEIVQKYRNFYFCFINTKKFFEHPQIIYLDKTFDNKYKAKFINSCDAMLHARSEGETFGLAVAEFSAANKPVLSCKMGDLEHLDILGKKAIIYENYNQLYNCIINFKKITAKRKKWNAYKKYEPKEVMKLFNEVCLERKKIQFFKKIKTFIRDLPWILRQKIIILKTFFIRNISS